MTRDQKSPTSRAIENMIPRFWLKAVASSNRDACWAWEGAKTAKGYGLIGIGGRSRGNMLAHRFSYRLHNGRIPKGQFVLHRCDNPSCTNPRHLFLGTQRDNLDDARKKGRLKPPPKATENAAKTHCVHGHPFSPENTYVIRNQRQCRTCKRNADRESKRKKA